MKIRLQLSIIFIVFLLSFVDSSFAQQTIKEHYKVNIDSLYRVGYAQKDSLKSLLLFTRAINPDHLKGIDKNQLLQFLENKINNIPNDGSLDYAELCFLIASDFHIFGHYYKSYEFIDRTYTIIKDINPDKISFAADFYNLQGTLYYFFRRLDKAKKSFLIALNLSRFHIRNRLGTINTLGLVYRDEYNNDSSVFYLNKGFKLADKTGNADWAGIMSGNLGYAYYMNGDYEKAKIFIERDKKLSLKNNENGSALNAIGLLVKIDLKNKSYNHLATNIHLMDSLSKTIGEYNTLRGYYETMTYYWEHFNDYKKALGAFRKSVEYKDSIIISHSQTRFQKIEFQIEFEKRKAASQLLIEKQKRAKQFSYGLVLIMFIIVIACIVLIYQVRKRRRNEKRIFELKNEKIQFELEINQRELRQLFKNIRQKNELIEALNEEIHENDRAEQSLSKQIEKQNLFEKIQSFTLLTEQDLVEFKTIFNKIHPGFYEYLNSNYPELSNAEMRLAMLIKLGLSNFEKAQILGISEDSVRKTNLRLRKKLNLTSVEELKSFILQINN